MQIEVSKYQNRHSLGNKIKRALWNVVYAILFRPTPTRLFRKWRNLLLRMFGAKIGNCTTVCPSVRIREPWNLEIGDWTILSDRVECYNVDRVCVGSRVVVSPDAFLCTASHDISSPNFELVTAPVLLGDDCWVSSRAIVMPGRKIGAGAVVAAGAVVTKDVPEWTVVGGNPAKFLKKRELKKDE